ncbi:hypothetical protein ACQPXH_26200 [Nocardia sp. CA-135953]|uniref:hypothetical protein n=1 Tax=Nocardia sp. CA-135953 TaxID=3239978 RepID=UPI003D968E79
MPEVDPKALVIRFRPMEPESLIKRAALDARRSEGGHHAVSVWCGVQEEGETESELRDRILDITVQNGLGAANNNRYWVCTTALELMERGFKFVKDGYDGEPEAHFSVILGDPPTLEDAKRFVEPFERMER